MFDSRRFVRIQSTKGLKTIRVLELNFCELFEENIDLIGMTLQCPLRVIHARIS